MDIILHECFRPGFAACGGLRADRQAGKDQMPSASKVLPQDHFHRRGFEPIVFLSEKVCRLGMASSRQ